MAHAIKRYSLIKKKPNVLNSRPTCAAPSVLILHLVLQELVLRENACPMMHHGRPGRGEYNP